MPTCRKHGSGGALNRKRGLIRYLAWITCGIPRDTPIEYCRLVAVNAALEALFNNGVGTPEQRLRAGLWVAEVMSEDTSERQVLDMSNTGD